MKQLSVNEIFYSIQGEGYWTGTPMIFIRLAGCNLKCSFCDTDFTKKERLTPKQIIKRLEPVGCTRVVLTGGEPTIQDLYPLVEALKDEDYTIHLETNGIYSHLIPGGIDWITFSPKRITTLVPEGTKEIKLLCGPLGWSDLAYSYIEPIPKIKWVGLQPISNKWEKTCLNFCLAHPTFRYSMQIHKKLKGVK